jgi:hypothetical protein
MQSKANFVITLVVTLFFSSFTQPLAAVDVSQLSATEFKEKWGQVIFCQTIYKMPEVKPRLYDFDLEQCSAAGQLALQVLDQYPPGDQTALRFQAEKHARAISLNTNEPYQAVPACRDYCRKLSELLNEQ